jgi:hypothetical protein
MVYCATYNDGQQQYIQSLVCIRSTPSCSTGDRARWWKEFLKVTEEVVMTVSVDFAVRMRFSQKRLERVLFLTAAERQRRDMEELGARFQSLNGIINGSIILPKDIGQYDEAARAIPRFRARLRQFSIPFEDDIRLVDDFQILADPSQLFEMAIARSWPLTYQVNAQRHRLTDDDVKWWKKNRFRIDAASQLPQKLKVAQESYDRRIDATAFLVEEFVASEDVVYCAAISEFVHDKLNSSYAKAFIESRLENECNGEFEEAFVGGFYPKSPKKLMPWHRAAASATANDVQALLQWQPKSERETLRQHLVEVNVSKTTIKNSNIGAVGDNANIQNLMQIKERMGDNLDLAKLANDLQKLRTVMERDATDAPQRLSAAAVAAAEQSARQKDGPKAIEYLKTAGEWALTVGEKIGVDVATATLKSVLNLP